MEVFRTSNSRILYKKLEKDGLKTWEKDLFEIDQFIIHSKTLQILERVAYFYFFVESSHFWIGREIVGVPYLIGNKDIKFHDFAAKEAFYVDVKEEKVNWPDLFTLQQNIVGKKEKDFSDYWRVRLEFGEKGESLFFTKARLELFLGQNGQQE